MNSAFLSQLRSEVIGCWLIATAALCAGLVINQFHDTPLPLMYKPKAARIDDAVAKIVTEPRTDTKPSGTTPLFLPARLTLEQIQVFVDQKQGLVLDARPEIFHRLGHIPGALALPRDDFENFYRQHQAVLESDKTQALVIYCSGGSCEDSDLIESALRKLGYTQISIFQGGWNEWKSAGLPEETR